MKVKSAFFIVVFLTTVVNVAADSGTVVFKTEPAGVPYRIPALGKCRNGDMIAVADYRYCKADIGNGPIDLHYRISHDNGATWGEERVLADGDDTLEGNDWRYAFGDACVVADGGSDEAVLFCVGGHVGFFESTADNPQHVVRFRSHDNGATWDGGACITPQVYGLYGERTAGHPEGIFLTSGRILQSRLIRQGDYYRLYIAHPIRRGGVGVICSDDFGETWQVLGSPDALPSVHCDEAVLEEMPDCSLLLSVREKGARFVNVFRYDSRSDATGFWDTETAAEGMRGVNACNGELLVVPAVRQSDGLSVVVVLHSLPQGSERADVGFFFKAIASPADYASSEAAASGWQKGLQVSAATSCYSTMQLLDDGSIVLLYEENGQNGGYDIVFRRLRLEEVTGGLYRAK